MDDNRSATDPCPRRGEGRVEAKPRTGVGSVRALSRVEIGRSLRKCMTPQEVKLWVWLREAIVPTGFHFRRQVPIDRYVVDFACLRARLIVEVDGEQHGREPHRERDAARDRRLGELGYAVLRFGNREIDREKQVVLDTLHARLVERGVAAPPRSAPPTRPSPRGEGSGRGCLDA